MKKYKNLEIIKHNKRLQKRFNLSINDYKEYYQLYSSIEIELNINEITFIDFINISKDEEEYYHIYFNSSNEENKRNYLKENEKVNKIRIRIDNQIKSFKELFCGCFCIISIIFKKFYRINITNMS